MLSGQKESWLRTCGWPSLILAAAWAITGHISFWLDVDHQLVTPAFFFPEAFSLAFVLRFGAGVWPGIFVGHQLLISGSNLPVLAGLGVSAANTLEAVLAVWLFRRLQGKSDIDDVRSWVLLQFMVFFVLQPFCATLGTGSLFASGVIGDGQAWLAAGLNWWSGSGMAQSQLAPLLLVLLHPRAQRVSWPRQIVLPALVTAAVLALALFALRGGVGTSLVLFQPMLVAFALLLGLPAVCVASVLISVAFLYTTSHGWGPFYLGDATSLFDLNVFLIGISLIGQFLAVLFVQLGKQRETERELRDAREQLQRTAYELTENIPIGTYVLEFDAGGNPHFTFLSERYLAMTGLKREEVMANHALALQPMSPPDRSKIEQLNREVFASKKPFFWEGEITVRGEKHHVTLESVPRERPDGGMVWEGVMTDITERKRSEKQLQLVLDNLPIAVAATTLTSPADMTFINEQFTRTFGYTLEDVPTVAAWAEKAYPDPDYRREVFREWDKSVFRAIESKGLVESMEFEVTCKDGTKRDVIFSAVVLDDRLLTSMTDVTELKKAQAALRSLREQLERTAFELTENIPVGTYTMVQPPEGGMAYFSFLSTRFLELTGLEREAARTNPMNAFACVHPDDHAEWVRKNAYAFEHKLPFREECRIVVGGETRWITAESTPRNLHDGSVVWEGVLTDITSRKEAEDRLSQANRNMRLAASAAQLGFWEMDVGTGLDTWDEEAARIAGIALADFDGRWEKFIHPEDYEEVMAETRRMLESDEIFAMDYRIVRPSGEVRHVREHGVVVRDEDGRAKRVHGVWADITEEKEAAGREKELEARHRRDLEVKLKTSLAAAGVAHEINQPLSAILLRTKMALAKKENESETLSAVADEAQRVVTTIEKMKTLMRNVQTEHKEFDLAGVVRSALLYNKTMLSRHDITVRESGLDKAQIIMGDDAQLQLAITNILRNAAEAIDESAAERREISIELTESDNEVVLTIGDSGPGWSGAQLADTPLTTTKKGGTGIGLYVARTAMENHRGEIVFGSSPLGGAEVRLKFPRITEKT